MLLAACSPQIQTHLPPAPPGCPPAQGTVLAARIEAAVRATTEACFVGSRLVLLALARATAVGDTLAINDLTYRRAMVLTNGGKPRKMDREARALCAALDEMQQACPSRIPLHLPDCISRNGFAHIFQYNARVLAGNVLTMVKGTFYKRLLAYLRAEIMLWVTERIPAISFRQRDFKKVGWWGHVTASPSFLQGF